MVSYSAARSMAFGYQKKGVVREEPRGQLVFLFTIDVRYLWQFLQLLEPVLPEIAGKTGIKPMS